MFCSLLNFDIFFFLILSSAQKCINLHSSKARKDLQRSDKSVSGGAKQI